MTFIPDHIVSAAAKTIITTRDFCGDEREAVRDFAIDNGFKADWQKLHKLATFRANNRWRNCQKAAGVKKPLW